MNAYTLTGPRLGGLFLPVTGCFATTPAAAALNITGDIDLRARASLRAIDNTGGAGRTLLGKWGSSGQRSYYFTVISTGRLQLVWTEDGSTVKALGADADRSITDLDDGVPYWFRVTLDVDNGASGHTGRFYTSTDGATWNQLGSDLTGSGVTSIHVGTTALEAGARTGSTDPLDGTLYAVEVRNGINGTIVAAPSFVSPLSYWRDINGDTRWDGHRVWTINGTACEWR